jgi:hypothetical protein
MQHFSNIIPMAGNKACISIELRSVYGEVKAYPACEKARIFADLAGTKTLTGQTLRLVELLGFRIVAASPLDLSAVR